MTTAAVEFITVSFPQRRVRPWRLALVASNIWRVYFRNVKEPAISVKANIMQNASAPIRNLHVAGGDRMYA